jgi:hypothetical protein
VISMMLSYAAASWAQLPSIDIRQTCWTAASVTTGLSTQRNFDLCMASESQANVRLSKEWGTFSYAHKQQCVRPMVYLPSYVEWLTCLEMETLAEQLRSESASIVVVFTLPRPRPTDISAVGSSEPPHAAPVILPRPRPSAATIESTRLVAIRPARHRRTAGRPPRSPAAAFEQKQNGAMSSAGW